MSSHRTKGVRAAVAVAALLVASACGGPVVVDDSDASLATMEPVTFRVSSSSPETAPSARSITKMTEFIEEESGGKIKFEHYYSGTLVPADRALSAVSSGLADIAFTSVTYDPGELEISNWINPMVTAAGPGMPMDALVGTMALNEIVTTNEAFTEEWAAKGVRPLVMDASDPWGLFCNKELSSPADIEGLRIRTIGGAWQKEVESLDAENVFVNTEELYEAFQRGVIDCSAASPSEVAVTGLHEVAKYYYPVTFSPNAGFGYIMSKKKWDALPQDAKDLFEKGRVVFDSTSLGLLYSGVSPLMSGDELEIIPMPELTEYLQDLQADVRAELPASAPDGVDGRQITDDFQQSVDVWRERLQDEYSVESNMDSPEGVKQTWEQAAALDWAALVDSIHE